MSQNPIQFQRGMPMAEFQENFGTEEKCEETLERARWPDGFVCPICGAHEHSAFEVKGQKVWQCARCKHQTTLRSGTLFHASKLPLTIWFLAIYLITQSKNNISDLSLKRYLGVCYRTAWRLKHKILEAMAEAESGRKLSGTVRADDAYLGGVRQGKRGRGAENKTLFILAVECTEDNHPLNCRLDLLPDLTGASVIEWASKALDSAAHLITDGFSSLAAAASQVAEHTPIIVSPNKSSELEDFRWVNILLSNLKTAISGTYHHIDARKYGRRYLAEFQYRFNRRFDLPSLVRRLLRACVATPPSPEKWLRLGQVRAI